MTRAIFFVAVAALLTIPALPADARGGHGLGGHGMAHGFADSGRARFARGRHGGDTYIKAASDERERLLDTQLKSICRGC